MGNNNKELWANNRKIHNLRYPDENVIKFLYKNFSNRQGTKVLDFGCGSGRNTIIMADLNLSIYAMDYNEECLELTAEKIGEYGDIHYIQNSELEIPLEDNSMDCIVAWGALFYQSRINENKLMSELVRVLKPNGLILADYRSKEDSLYGQGEKIEEDFFRLNDSCGSLSGISYAFRDIEELKGIYTKHGMNIFEYEKHNHYIGESNICMSHYIIWAKKEEIKCKN